VFKVKYKNVANKKNNKNAGCETVTKRLFHHS